ncbi:hypothetical protein JHK87_033650 [Glycine soja]|nr:hypothetical protein JHK87_033650 [Glycine soja]
MEHILSTPLKSFMIIRSKLFSSCTTRSIPSSITVNFSPLHLSSLQSCHRRSFLISCDSSRCRSSFGDSHDNNNYLEASLLLSKYTLPKLYAKMQYCVSRVIHSHVVRVQSCIDRRKCEPPQRFIRRRDPSPRVNGRYSDHMLPEVEVKDFRMDAQLLLLHRAQDRDSLPPYPGLFGELVLTARTFVCFCCKDLVYGTRAHCKVYLGCSLCSPFRVLTRADRLSLNLLVIVDVLTFWNKRILKHNEQAPQPRCIPKINEHFYSRMLFDDVITLASSILVLFSSTPSSSFGSSTKKEEFFG